MSPSPAILPFQMSHRPHHIHAVVGRFHAILYILAGGMGLYAYNAYLLYNLASSAPQKSTKAAHPQRGQVILLPVPAYSH